VKSIFDLLVFLSSQSAMCMLDRDSRAMTSSFNLKIIAVVGDVVRRHRRRLCSITFSMVVHNAKIRILL